MSSVESVVMTPMRRARIRDSAVWALPIFAMSVAVLAMVLAGIAWWRSSELGVPPTSSFPPVSHVGTSGLGPDRAVGDDVFIGGVGDRVAGGAIGDDGAHGAATRLPAVGDVRRPTMGQCQLVAVWVESGRQVCIDILPEGSGLGPVAGGERGGSGR